MKDSEKLTPEDLHILLTNHETFFAIAYRHHQRIKGLVKDRNAREIKDNSTQNELIKLANSEKFRKEINKRSLEAFKTIIDLMTSNPEQFKVKSSETKYSEKIFLEGLKILSRNLGVFRVYRYRCRKCDAYMNCNKCGFNCEIAYKSINAPDVTHVLISDSIGCKYFFTMDRYFGKIPKEEFKTEIIVL